MTLYKLYLEAPDIEIFVAEKRGDLKKIGDDERHIPAFGALELKKVLDCNPSAYEFRVICLAKNKFDGNVLDTRAVDDE